MNSNRVYRTLKTRSCNPPRGLRGQRESVFRRSYEDSWIFPKRNTIVQCSLKLWRRTGGKFYRTYCGTYCTGPNKMRTNYQYIILRRERLKSRRAAFTNGRGKRYRKNRETYRCCKKAMWNHSVRVQRFIMYDTRRRVGGVVESDYFSLPTATLPCRGDGAAGRSGTDENDFQFPRYFSLVDRALLLLGGDSRKRSQ